MSYSRRNRASTALHGIPRSRQKRWRRSTGTIDESAASLREIQRQLDDSRDLTQALAKERDEARIQVGELKKQGESTKRSLVTLKGRRSVRLMLGIAKMARPLFRTVRYLKRRVSGTPSSVATTADSDTHTPRRAAEPQQAPVPSARQETVLKKNLVAARSAQTVPASGPLVSIVVVTRDGLNHLQRLFDGLAHRTDYSDFEVIVVDNASTDGTIAFLDRAWHFPVIVVQNATNQSFSDSNNRGVGVGQRGSDSLSQQRRRSDQPWVARRDGWSAR